MRVPNLILSLLILVLIAGTSPVAANHVAAQADRGDCAGVAEWYAGVDQIKAQVERATDDPTVSYGTLDPELFRGAAQQLDGLAVPESVDDAQQALMSGYQLLTESVEATLASQQAMQSGTFASYDEQAQIVALVNQGRAQLLGGYLGWTVAGVSCGITSETFLPAPERGCTGVPDFLNTAEAALGSFWDFWDQIADGTIDTSALPLGSGEMLAGAAFDSALKLATTPAPAEAMALQLATVQYLGALSDLYTLNLLAAMGVYYGLDQQGVAQIVAQHDRQIQLTRQQAEQIAGDWETLADQCHAEARFPRPKVN